MCLYFSLAVWCAACWLPRGCMCDVKGKANIFRPTSKLAGIWYYVELTSESAAVINSRNLSKHPEATLMTATRWRKWETHIWRTSPPGVQFHWIPKYGLLTAQGWTFVVSLTVCHALWHLIEILRLSPRQMLTWKGFSATRLTSPLHHHHVYSCIVADLMDVHIINIIINICFYHYFQMVISHW